MNTRSLGLLTIPVALSMLSCGDAVSPPAEGTISVTINNSPEAEAGYGCDTTAGLLLGREAPGPSTQGSTWVDGQESHSVSCSVKGGGTFDFSGTIGGNQANFSISGTVDSGGSGTASVYIFEPTLRIGLSDKQCKVEATGSYKVEKGAIWAGVDCLHLTSSDDFRAWCRALGTFVFKSCED